MAIDPGKVREASRLISCALQPAKRPTNDVDYERLVRAYHDDPEIALAVQEVCAGLGLRLLEVSDFGVSLGANADSPFGLTLREYRDRMTAEERLLHGLIHVALAAYLYPRPEDLEAEDLRPVSILDLEKLVRDLCKAAADKTSDAPDAPAAFPDLENAYRVYLRWPATKETTDGRRAAKSTQGLIAQVLNHLADQGLLQRVAGSDGESFLAMRRYRVQVRELAAHEALIRLRELRSH